jgi:hypothetical protein
MGSSFSRERDLDDAVEKRSKPDRTQESANLHETRIMEAAPDENYEMTDRVGPSAPGDIDPVQIEGTDRIYEGKELPEDTEPSPNTVGRMLDEKLENGNFIATYEFKKGPRFEEEVPLISQLQTEEIENLLQGSHEDVELTVTEAPQGYHMTIEYEDPDSITEAVYTTDQVIQIFDQVSDETDQADRPISQEIY